MYAIFTKYKYILEILQRAVRNHRNNIIGTLILMNHSIT